MCIIFQVELRNGVFHDVDIVTQTFFPLSIIKPLDWGSPQDFGHVTAENAQIASVPDDMAIIGEAIPLSDEIRAKGVDTTVVRPIDESMVLLDDHPVIGMKAIPKTAPPMTLRALGKSTQCSIPQETPKYHR